MRIMPRRRDVMKFAGLNMLAALGNAGAAAAKLPNATLDAGKAKLTKEAFGDLRIYFEGPTDQLKSMTAGSLLLKPGMTPHPPHQHPEEEFMVVTEGAGEISIDGKITKVGPGSMMYAAAGRLHGIVNTGASRCCSTSTNGRLKMKLSILMPVYNERTVVERCISLRAGRAAAGKHGARAGHRGRLLHRRHLRHPGAAGRRASRRSASSGTP